MNRQEIEKELGLLKPIHPNGCKNIIALVEQFLSASEKLPEKIFTKDMDIDDATTANIDGINGYNNALNACTLIIARDYIEKSKLPTETDKTKQSLIVELSKNAAPYNLEYALTQSKEITLKTNYVYELLFNKPYPNSRLVGKE